MTSSEFGNAKVRIAGIVPESIVDGPGIRIAIFMQGCSNKCKGCQNPETWDFNGGTEITLSDLWDKIREFPYIRNITFSGGDPIFQIETLLPIIKKLKQANYNICVYTGFTFEQLQRMPEKFPAICNIDILIDGPYIEEQRSLELKFKGSFNQRIIDVQKSLDRKEVILYKV